MTFCTSAPSWVKSALKIEGEMMNFFVIFNSKNLALNSVRIDHFEKALNGVKNADFVID